MENFDIKLKKNEEEESTLNYPLIVGIIIGLLLIGGGAYWFFTKDNSDEDVENQELISDAENADENDSTTEKVVDSTDFEQNSIDDTTGNTSVNDSIDTAGNNQTEQAEQTEQDDSTYQNNETSASADDYVYFIVSGAFRNENNAQNKLQDLKSQGFNAVIVGPKSNGLFIVAYEGFTNINDTKIKLKEIRQNNPQAWIYKKK